MAHVHLQCSHKGVGRTPSVQDHAGTSTTATQTTTTAATTTTNILEAPATFQVRAATRKPEPGPGGIRGGPGAPPELPVGLPGAPGGRGPPGGPRDLKHFKSFSVAVFAQEVDLTRAGTAASRSLYSQWQTHDHRHRPHHDHRPRPHHRRHHRRHHGPRPRTSSGSG